MKKQTKTNNIKRSKSWKTEIFIFIFIFILSLLFITDVTNFSRRFPTINFDFWEKIFIPIIIYILTVGAFEYYRLAKIREKDIYYYNALKFKLITLINETIKNIDTNINQSVDLNNIENDVLTAMLNSSDTDIYDSNEVLYLCQKIQIVEGKEKKEIVKQLEKKRNLIIESFGNFEDRSNSLGTLSIKPINRAQEREYITHVKLESEMNNLFPGKYKSEIRYKGSDVRFDGIIEFEEIKVCLEFKTVINNDSLRRILRIQKKFNEILDNEIHKFVVITNEIVNESNVNSFAKEHKFLILNIDTVIKYSRESRSPELKDIILDKIGIYNESE